MLLNIIYFVIGLLLIIKGADWLTDSASNIARRFNVPSLVIGMTIVAFGTSAPELVVSVVSSIDGKPDMAIGNVVGSNLFNTLAIVGITALIYPISCKESTRYIDLPVCVFASALLYFMVSDSCLWGRSDQISRIDGAIMLIIFIAYMTVLFKTRKKDKNVTTPSVAIPHKTWEIIKEDKKEMSVALSVLLFAIGLSCLIFGGNWFVDGASGIASGLGVSQSTIALTIVAAGTSFPELFTSIIAARKGDTDMALGNVIGSNVFNILLILGISGLIQPLELGTVKHINIILLLVSSVMMLLFACLGKSKFFITRMEGLILTIMAIAYYTYLVVCN